MEGSSQPRMKGTNDVPNDAGEERRGYGVMSYIRMCGLRGVGRGDHLF